MEISNEVQEVLDYVEEAKSLLADAIEEADSARKSADAAWDIVNIASRTLTSLIKEL